MSKLRVLGTFLCLFSGLARVPKRISWFQGFQIRPRFAPASLHFEDIRVWRSPPKWHLRGAPRAVLYIAYSHVFRKMALISREMHSQGWWGCLTTSKTFKESVSHLAPTVEPLPVSILGVWKKWSGTDFFFMVREGPSDAFHEKKNLQRPKFRFFFQIA